MPTGIEVALAPLAKEKGLLTLLYQDLAQPGVQQVGKALATVLGVGNTILIPLRMLNEAGRNAERASFEQIASRFSQIPPDDVIEVRPEIGVPILENLSRTTDPDLREMFIELLASAASSKQVQHAHPSFPSIISNLSPDEAQLLRYLKDNTDVPAIELDMREEGRSDFVPLYGYHISFPGDLTFPNNIPLYVSNLAGLGLVELIRDSWLTGRDLDCDVLFENVKKASSLNETTVVGQKTYKIHYKKHILRLLPLGVTLMRACAP